MGTSVTVLSYKKIKNSVGSVVFHLAQTFNILLIAQTFPQHVWQISIFLSVHFNWVQDVHYFTEYIIIIIF